MDFFLPDGPNGRTRRAAEVGNPFFFFFPSFLGGGFGIASFERMILAGRWGLGWLAAQAAYPKKEEAKVVGVHLR